MSRFSAIHAEVVVSASLPFLFCEWASFLGLEAVDSLDCGGSGAILALDLPNSGVSVVSGSISHGFGECTPVVVEVAAFLYHALECVWLWNELCELVVECWVDHISEEEYLGGLIDACVVHVFAPFLVPLIKFAIALWGVSHLLESRHVGFQVDKVCFDVMGKFLPSLVDRWDTFIVFLLLGRCPVSGFGS